jgi:hypothetical protein
MVGLESRSRCEHPARAGASRRHCRPRCQSPKSRTARFRGVVSGCRYYNPSTGRWLSRDPLGDEVFLKSYSAGRDLRQQVWLRSESLQPSYVFTGNQPITSSDCFGLDRWYNVVGFHAYIIVDTWVKCCKTGQVRIEFGPANAWDEFVSLTGITVPGSVLIQHTSGGDSKWYSHHASSTCAQDRALLNVATELQQTPPNYNINGYSWGVASLFGPSLNCYTFAYLLFGVQ